MLPSDISRPVERREATAVGLAATFTGTNANNVNCLLWSIAPTFALGSVNRGIAGAGWIQNANAPGVAPVAGAWFNCDNSATFGTMISLLEPGAYLLKLDAVQTAAASLVYAISMNGNFSAAAAAQTNLVAGVETSTGTVTTVAADVAPINLMTIVYVSPTQAAGERALVTANGVNAATNLTNHATIRFHCSQAGGGVPLDAEILQTQFRYTVRWLGEMRGA